MTATLYPRVTLASIKAPGRYSLVGGPFGSKLVSADYVGDGVPVIRGTNLPSEARFSFDDLVHVTSEKVERDLVGNLAFPGDLVVTQRGTLGQVGLIPPTSPWGRFVISQSQMKLTVDDTKADRTFVYYALRAPLGQHEILSRALTAGVPHINLGLLGQVQIPSPPLAIQRKVAAILSAYDHLIENNNHRIKILEEMAQRVCREWFVHFRYPGHESVRLVETEFGPIPQEWNWRELREVAEEMRVAVDPVSVHPSTPYVGLEHMPEGSIAISDWGSAAEAGSRKYRFQVGDVLFGKIRPYFHKVCVVPVDGICSTDAIVIRARTDGVRGLVLAIVSSDAFVQEAVQTSQGTKMPRANWNVLERYRVAVPPALLVEKFNVFMKDTVAAIHRWVMASRNLRETRDLLLPGLISGEIDVDHLDIPNGEAAA